jgi:hypothetical protein
MYDQYTRDRLSECQTETERTNVLAIIRSEKVRKHCESVPNQQLRDGYFAVRMAQNSTFVIYHRRNKTQAVWETNSLYEAVEWSMDRSMPFDRVNYQGMGDLVDARYDKDGRLTVIARNRTAVQPYCVANYTPGAEDRESGTYYGRLSEAAEDLESR